MSTSSGARTHQLPLLPSDQRPVPEPSSDSRAILFFNAVYYPNWMVYRQRPPSSLSLEYVSHVFYAFAWVQPDGNICLSDEHADTQIEVDGVHGCLRALSALKQYYPVLKLILSVGGGRQGSTQFPGVARNNLSRYTFARSAKAMIDAYGFDGIDVDWEYPLDQQQGLDYVNLLSALRFILPSPQYILTSALPAGEWALRHIDVVTASTYLDLINLMAYDFSGPWLEATGHQSQLYSSPRPHNYAATLSCHSAVSYLRAQGVPSTKILLGVPVYGRSFLGANNVGQVYTSQGGHDGTFEYQTLPRFGAQEYVDMQLGAAYCVGGDGGFVTYDNPQTVQMKASYVKHHGMRGLFYWTGTADASGVRSLVETGYNTLHDV